MLSHCAGRHIRALQAGPFFVSVTVHRSGLRLGSHCHSNACFHYVLRGAYAESTRNAAWTVPPRNALLKPPHLAHWNDFTHEACSLRIEFPVTALAECAERLPNGLLLLSGPRIARTCTEILAELDLNDDCSAFAVEGLCTALLAQSLRAARSGARRIARPPECVVSCEGLLREQYRDRLRFDDIAVQVGVSRTHLATVFRAHHGYTMGEFVRRLRIDYIKQQLRTTARSIAEIALAAGFADQSHCTRVFRAHLGLPPIEWRSCQLS